MIFSNTGPIQRDPFSKSEAITEQTVIMVEGMPIRVDSYLAIQAISERLKASGFPGLRPIPEGCPLLNVQRGLLTTAGQVGQASMIPELKLP